jgi:ArsR family transcriptional regulator
LTKGHYTSRIVEVTNSSTIEADRLAVVYKALGDPTRLRVFRFLCSCRGDVAVDEEGQVRNIEGATVGEVCCRVTGVDRITSTLSFHLKELRNAGLITMERRGRHVLCRANPEALEMMRRHVAALESCSSDCQTERGD